MAFSFLLQISTADTTSMMPDGTPAGIKEVPLWDIIAQSNQGIGWLINLILTLMLGYAIFVFVERFLALRKASSQDSSLIRKVKEYISSGKLDSAVDYCGRSNSPTARMLEKGISRIGRPLESISASIENTGKLEILRLEQRLSFLATAAGAAPMIGFLGTTVGMVRVFIDLSNATSLELKIIAPGIMTAMITTVAGLIVGIITYMGYNYLVGRIGKVVYQMENTALEFMDLLHQPGK